MRKALLVALAVSLLVPAVAGAHLERPSYWPDPKPDRAVTPAAGGGVPKARSLQSVFNKRALRRTRPRTQVRVVCQGSSLRRLKIAASQARRNGFRLRPSQPVKKISRKQARKMIKLNQRLKKKCRYRSIQKAIDASGNNDRIVIMPGVYTEAASRRAPANDPRCNPSLLQKDASGDSTPSYEYQVTCPNDQNLLYLNGRAIKGKPLPAPRSDRRGIPTQELGACVRCNVQIEGSGVKPEDVIMDAGENYQGQGAEARPRGHAKHVVLRTDRADGFVGRNFLTRGGLEFGFYTEETDGVLLDKTKFFWNADYGHLSFTTDHNLIKNCDGMGAGDAAIYPGAAPETGSQATKDFYPDAPRYNTTVTRCDMRHSALGYSGSMGNAVRITNNHIYGNATGIASDTLSSAGHPGFPADGVKVDNNLIYSNNFNVYRPDSPVKPLVGIPVGTGIVYAGMNDARVHDNYFFDNWRDGTMLFAVPDALTSYGGPEGDVYPGVSCATKDQGLSTSCGNRQYSNKMGQVPRGFAFPHNLDRFFPVVHATPGARTMPNGNDFWWDEFSTNTGNCWFSNTGPDGRAGSVSGPGEAGRAPASPPQTLPNCSNGSAPNSSRGGGDTAKTQYLIDCSNGPDQDTGPLACDWWTTPPKPGSAAAARRKQEVAAAARGWKTSPEALRLQKRIDDLVSGAAARR